MRKIYHSYFRLIPKETARFTCPLQCILKNHDTTCTSTSMRGTLTERASPVAGSWLTYSLISLTVLSQIKYGFSSSHPSSFPSSSSKSHTQRVLIRPINFRSRTVRGIHSRPPIALTYSLDMFGATYRLHLQQALVASSRLESVVVGVNGTVTVIPVSYSQAHCHYAGTVRTCQPASGSCYEGQAAMSRFAHGLRGVMKIGGEDILIEPLPETLLAKRMR